MLDLGHPKFVPSIPKLCGTVLVGSVLNVELGDDLAESVADPD